MHVNGNVALPIILDEVGLWSGNGPILPSIENIFPIAQEMNKMAPTTSEVLQIGGAGQPAIQHAGLNAGLCQAEGKMNM